jgi:hypothetical protein
LIAYLLFPARTRFTRTQEVIQRIQDSLTDQDEYVREVFEQSQASLLKRIKDSFRPNNYILPIAIMAFVLGGGFFIIFSAVVPLYKFDGLDELLLNIPASVFHGFIGGWFYVLYSLVNRYRSADIPPGLVLQLAYQIFLAGAVAYFAVTISPDLTDPAVAFASGFIPYAEIAGWLRLTAQTKLGTSSASTPGGSAPSGQISDSLAKLQGLAPAHRERLGEENILTIQNLALANPLSLYLVTSFEMSTIIDWIDQAYLRIYVTDDAATRLAANGIRGAIEFKQIKDYKPQDEAAFFDSLAQALGSNPEGARYFLDQFAGDPQIAFLERLWAEFGGN